MLAEMGYSSGMSDHRDISTQADRQRWDQRYREGAYAQRTWPSGYLQHLVDEAIAPASGRALDVACGRGRNSLYLASQGFAVDAVDVAPVAIAYAATAAMAQGLRVRWQCRDMFAAADPVPAQAYALIVMFRFVAPTLIPRLLEGLAPNGVLVVEEHLQWSQSDSACTAGPLAGPSSDRFRVAPGELREQLLGAGTSAGIDYDVLDQFEGLIAEATEHHPDASAAVSRMCIRRRSK